MQFVGGGGRGRLGGRGEAVVGPELLEPLAFTVVVAEHVDGETAPEPAMQLGEELAPLRLGHRRLGGPGTQGTKHLQALES
jgi:hypothetical protein